MLSWCQAYCRMRSPTHSAPSPVPEAQAGGELAQLRAAHVQPRKVAAAAHVQQLQRGGHHCEGRDVSYGMVNAGLALSHEAVQARCGLPPWCMDDTVRPGSCAPAMQHTGTHKEDRVSTPLRDASLWHCRNCTNLHHQP